MGSIGRPETSVNTCEFVPLLRQDKRDFLFHEASVPIFWDWGPLPVPIFWDWGLLPVCSDFLGLGPLPVFRFFGIGGPSLSVPIFLGLGALSLSVPIFLGLGAPSLASYSVDTGGFSPVVKQWGGGGVKLLIPIKCRG